MKGFGMFQKGLSVAILLVFFGAAVQPVAAASGRMNSLGKSAKSSKVSTIKTASQSLTVSNSPPSDQMLIWKNPPSDLTLILSPLFVTVDELTTNRFSFPVTVTGRVSEVTPDTQLSVILSDYSASRDYPATSITLDGDGYWEAEFEYINFLMIGPGHYIYYDVVAIATDVGRYGQDDTFNEILLDGCPPRPSLDYLKTNDNTPRLTGKTGDEEFDYNGNLYYTDRATILVTVDGEEYPARNEGDGTWTLDDNVVTALADGDHSASVTVTDAAGNVGSYSRGLYIDTTPLALKNWVVDDELIIEEGVGPDNASCISGSTMTFLFDGEVGIASSAITVLQKDALGQWVDYVDDQGNPKASFSWNYEATELTVTFPWGANGNYCLSGAIYEEMGNVLTITEGYETSIRFPGDGNFDGIVDLADYTIWADNYGKTDARNGGDFDFDGVVDLEDYVIWADVFGRNWLGW
jgi:hypothetical protein